MGLPAGAENHQGCWDNTPKRVNVTRPTARYFKKKKNNNNNKKQTNRKKPNQNKTKHTNKSIKTSLKRTMAGGAEQTIETNNSNLT